jgi:hypothetical protein
LVEHSTMLTASFHLGNYLYCAGRVSLGCTYLLNLLLHEALAVLISLLMMSLLLVSW